MADFLNAFIDFFVALFSALQGFLGNSFNSRSLENLIAQLQGMRGAVTPEDNSATE